VQLAADYSAPTRYGIGREKRTYLQGFLRPGGATDEAELILLEPYQPGKIPLVFIHGLLSDPMTWAELYETIKVDPELRDRYQFWAFQYPTGAAFLRSAAILRRELAAVIAYADPDGADPALSQMVLVSHSMGGLLAKLQITSSEDRVWRSFANRPMERLQLTPRMHARLQELFYFEPSPHIRRVVFIGTPHNGSNLANRMIGRIGSYLVRIPDEDKREYDVFLAANPGVVHEFAAKRIPTSVDMLEPDNPILRAMACLPKSPCVVTHSIVGTGGCSLFCEPSDGVVPVASARIAGVESELFVDAEHEVLHRDPETIHEVVRILRRHLLCVDADPQ
jgi:pimeloyl-ACP methyl ester carboxylesterase